MYRVLLIIHIVTVFLYIALFIIRFGYLTANRHERFFLFSERTKAFSIIIQTFLVISSIYLGLTYDYEESGRWLIAKLILLFATVFVGNYAFQNYHKGYATVTLFLLIYIVALSYTKSIFLAPLE
ncbi:MAG: SirB2 family protein [Bacteroidota bacterium]|nr:SirB2 family protein [Bacteroidota bacterium]